MARTNKSASIETYNAIKEDIIYQRIRGGESLIEDELAEKYNVSRTPIREALKWLESDGLVVYYPYRGCFVKEFSEKDIVEIYTVRKALEGTCCRVAAEFITSANIDMLEKNHYKSLEEFRAGDVEKADDLGDKLHDVIIDISGNSRIKSILNMLDGQQRYFSIITKRLDGRMEKSLQEHEQILEALKQHDGELAEQRMREHIESTMRDMLMAVRNARVHI